MSWALPHETRAQLSQGIPRIKIKKALPLWLGHGDSLFHFFHFDQILFERHNKSKKRYFAEISSFSDKLLVHFIFYSLQLHPWKIKSAFSVVMLLVRRGDFFGFFGFFRMISDFLPKKRSKIVFSAGAHVAGAERKEGAPAGRRASPKS